MKKDPNSGSSILRKRATLPKSGILRGRKQFERLFASSASTYHARHVSLRYYFREKDAFDCQMGFIVAKRLGKAVDRNYIKRILKEAYRLHNDGFINTLRKADVSFTGALVAKTLDVDFAKAEQDVVRLMDLLINKLAVEIEA